MVGIDHYFYAALRQITVHSVMIWILLSTFAGLAAWVMCRKGGIRPFSAKVLPFLVLYLSFVITITLTGRNTEPAAAYNLELFWTYRTISAGYYPLIAQIFWNIILFIPIGVMLPLIWKGKRLRVYMGCGLLFSAGIEILQLLMHRGLFEFDDMFHNTVGMAVGFLLVHPFERRSRKVLLCGIAVFLLSGFFLAWGSSFLS